MLLFGPGAFRPTGTDRATGRICALAIRALNLRYLSKPPGFRGRYASDSGRPSAVAIVPDRFITAGFLWQASAARQTRGLLAYSTFQKFGGKISTWTK